MQSARSNVASIALTVAIGRLGGPATPAGPARVEIRNSADFYQLLVNGQPYRFNGVGLECGSPERFAAHGANSFRTWRTENGREGGRAVLDRAWRHGLTVAMGLEVVSERHGLDYNNPTAVARQLSWIKAEVLKYKDHRSLLLWIIGNELNLGSRNPAVWNAVNEISQMIHEVDPNHPTLTTLAGVSPALSADIRSRAPALDLLGFQMYDGIVNLPRALREANWTGPYLVTEWGATGHWEAPKAEWSAPIENDSTTKAEDYRKRFDAVIRTHTNQCLGSYVFLWGQKQERTPTWYGMFLESGEETEAVDVMHRIWRGVEPANRSPRVKGAWLDARTASGNVRLRGGQSYSAYAEVEDADGDPLTFYREIREESTDLKSGGDLESKPPVLAGLIPDPGKPQITLTAPPKSGAYRLFVYAYDGHGHAAHANIPFFVNAPSARAQARRP